MIFTQVAARLQNQKGHKIQSKMDTGMLAKISNIAYKYTNYHIKNQLNTYIKYANISIWGSQHPSIYNTVLSGGASFLRRGPRNRRTGTPRSRIRSLWLVLGIRVVRLGHP